MPKGLTKQQIFTKLLLLASMPHGDSDHPHPQPWTGADRLDQDALFNIQESVLQLLHDIARDLGPAAEARLVACLPWAFHTAVAQKGG